MKKMVLVIIGALIVGFLLGKFVLDQYDSKDKVTPTFNFGGDKSTKVSFFQYGVYSTVESMENNTISLSKYIYLFKDNLYYVFIGISKDDKNIEKIKGYFEVMGYSTYVKVFDISDRVFLDELTSYDSLLKQTDDYKAIGIIINQILERYEEVEM